MVGMRTILWYRRFLKASVTLLSKVRQGMYLFLNSLAHRREHHTGGADTVSATPINLLLRTHVLYPDILQSADILPRPVSQP